MGASVLFFFFIFFFLSHSSYTGCSSNMTRRRGGCIETKMLSLLALKEGIYKPPPPANNWLSSWRAATDCCTWPGVGCDHIAGHVIELNLRYPYDWVEYLEDGLLDVYEDRFPGPSKLNSSLLGLMHLRHLDLSMNYFDAQPIPKFIGSLVKLEYLNLSFAGFSGSIPPHLGNLSTLRVLDLSMNYFYPQPIPKFIGSLVKLEYLNLSHAWFSGSIPPHLGNLSTLRVLDLHSYYDYYFYMTSSESLDWVSRITSLEYLDLSGVNLSKAGDNWIHDINMLPSLSVLLLSYDQLEKIPYSLPQSNFTSLTKLDLSGNNFGSAPPNWLFNITTLLHLDLFNCHFSGGVQISKVFGVHSRLQYLDLGYNKIITGDIQELLGNFTDLVYLDLANNTITGEIPQNIENLSKLEVLYLRMNNFGGNIPETMGSL